MADLDPGENTKRENAEELAAGAASAAAAGVTGAATSAGIGGAAAGAVAGQMAADNVVDREVQGEGDVRDEDRAFGDIPNYIKGTPASPDSPGSPGSFAGEGNSPDLQRDLYDEKHGLHED